MIFATANSLCLNGHFLQYLPVAALLPAIIVLSWRLSGWQCQNSALNDFLRSLAGLRFFGVPLRHSLDTSKRPSISSQSLALSCVVALVPTEDQDTALSQRTLQRFLHLHQALLRRRSPEYRGASRLKFCQPLRLARIPVGARNRSGVLTLTSPRRPALAVRAEMNRSVPPGT